MKNGLSHKIAIISFAIILLLSPIFSIIVKSETYNSTIVTGAAGRERVLGIVVDNDGNVIITGGFSDTTNLEIDNNNPKTSNGDYDVFVAKYDNVGNHVWSKTFGGTEEDYGTALTVDSSGNIYVVGYFQETVNFGNVTKTAAGCEDIFIIKYSPSGDVQWVKTIGGQINDYAHGVVLDSNNNLYVTGSFIGINPVNFNPDGSDPKSGFGVGGTDIFLSKWSSNGTYQWTKVFGGTSQDRGYRVKVDGNDNVYIAGLFGSDSVDFSLSGSDLRNSGQGWSFYLSKWNADNTYAWTKTFGPVSNSYSFNGVSLAVSNDGDSYIAASYDKQLNFNPDGSDVRNPDNGHSDYFLSKWNANGTYGWTKTFGSENFDHVEALDLNSKGDVFITGGFGDTVNFNPDGNDTRNAGLYGGDIFISSWSSNGTYRWTKSMGEEDAQDEGLALTVKNDNVYVAGMFSGTINFNPDGNDTKTAPAEDDIFITMLNSGSSSGSNPIPYTPNVCKPIDTNGDGILNYIDLASFSVEYHSTCTNEGFAGDTYNCGSQDTNNDGVLDYKDLASFSVRYHTVKDSCGL